MIVNEKIYNKKEASHIMGNSFGLLLLTSFILMSVSFVFCKPILFLFGASKTSYVYAAEYLRITNFQCHRRNSVLYDYVENGI